MHVIDLIVFFLYLAGITVFGLSFYRKNKSSSAFTLGLGNIPGWVITLSFFATYVSSISYLALPGSAYLGNWNAFVFSLSIPLAAVIGMQVFVPLYRRVNSPSAYTFLEQRFGPWARVYASASYFLTQLMRIGTILYLLALTINSIFGWDLAAVIIICGVAVLIYSLLGGIQAVVWTDAIQAIILITGAIACGIFILFSMPGDSGQLFEIAAKNQKFSLGSFDSGLSEPTFWVVLVYGIFINLQNYGIDQNYVQRYLASKSDREAKRSAFNGGMLYIPVSMLLLFIGTALFSYYQTRPGLLSPGLQAMENADAIFPFFIVNELPMGLSGLLIASIFAAGMSTISTSYNSMATVFLSDYYRRFFKKDASEKDAMKVLYLSTLVISICGIGIALAMINVKSVLDSWWKLASVFSGGMLGLFLLALAAKTRRSTGAVIGVTAGVGVILWMSLSELFFSEAILGKGFHAYLTIVFGTLTIFFVGFLAMHVLNKFDKL